MKRSKQVNESREMIVQAFRKLLRNSDYNDITLSEIADEAGLARMTLYRHFRNKDNILLHIAQRVQEQAWEKWNGDSSSIGEVILFQLVETAKLPNRFVLAENQYVWGTVQSYLERIWIDTLTAFLGLSFDEDPHLFLFLTGGFSRIYFDWLTNDCAQSPDEIRDRVIGYFRMYQQTTDH